MRKLLSFLGLGSSAGRGATGGYQEVTYFWDGSLSERFGSGSDSGELTTSLFPLVAFEIVRPDKLVLFCTKESREGSLVKLADGSEASSVDFLRGKLGDKLEIREIPSTSSEEDIWRIFEALDSAVDRGDEVVLDVTHSFRFIPLVSLSVLYYLNAVKEVKVLDVLYGAFDARSKHGGKAPVFSLLSFLDIVQWAEGLKNFKERFDARGLARKLAEVQDSFYRRSVLGANRDARDPSGSFEAPVKLKTLSSALEALSQSMSASSLLEISEVACRLERALAQAKPEIERWAKPFRAILEELERDLGRFSLTKPEELSRETLGAQLSVIERMFEAGLYLQAALALREWLLSWAMLRSGAKGNWLSYDDRDGFSSALARELKRRGEAQPEEDLESKGDRSLELDESLLGAGFLKLWEKTFTLRNGLAHCGIREKSDRVNSSSIRGRLKEIIDSAKTLLDGTPGDLRLRPEVEVDLSALYRDAAKLDDLEHYLGEVDKSVPDGADVVLTGRAPIWLYLKVAHHLHGKARRLLYRSPEVGEVLVFDHSSS